MKKLEDAAEIVYGTKTGYDEYFVLSKESVKDWQIERKYLRPCAPPGDSIDGLVINERAVSQYFLWATETEAELKGTSVLKYIKHGESVEVEPRGRRKNRPKLPEVESVKNNVPWYNFGKKPLASIFFPMWFRYKYRAFLNGAHVHALDSFYYIIAKSESEEKPLAGLLNSTISQLSMEILGRQYSGMLHTKVYELKQLPVLDLGQLSTFQKRQLSDLFEKLNDAIEKKNQAQAKFDGVKSNKEGQKGLFEEGQRRNLQSALDFEAKVRGELDNYIYDVLGLSEVERREISKGLEALRELRKARTRLHTVAESVLT